MFGAGFRLKYVCVASAASERGYCALPEDGPGGDLSCGFARQHLKIDLSVTEMRLECTTTGMTRAG